MSKAPYSILWTPPPALVVACLSGGVCNERPAIVFAFNQGGNTTPHLWQIGDPNLHDPEYLTKWALALRWEGRPCVFSRRRATYLLARHEEEIMGGLDLPADFDPEAMFYAHHTGTRAGDLWCLTGLDGFAHTYTFVAPKAAPNAECTDGHTLDYADEDTHEIECYGQPTDVDSALVTILTSRLGGSLHIIYEPKS